MNETTKPGLESTPIRGAVPAPAHVREHPVIFFLGTLLAGFLAGLGAYSAILSLAGRQTVSSERHSELISKEKSVDGLKKENQVLSAKGGDAAEARIRMELMKERVSALESECRSLNEAVYSRDSEIKKKDLEVGACKEEIEKLKRDIEARGERNRTAKADVREARRVELNGEIIGRLREVARRFQWVQQSLVISVKERHIKEALEVVRGDSSSKASELQHRDLGSLFFEIYNLIPEQNRDRVFEAVLGCRTLRTDLSNESWLEGRPTADFWERYHFGLWR